MSHRPREMANGKWEMGSRPLSISHFPFPLLLLASCAWFTDFKQQPKMDPWETASDTIAMRGNPQGSVPVYGTAAPGFAYGRAPTHPAIDSMNEIANPNASDARSLANGHKQFAINCAVCHGDRGMGDGPVTKFGLPVLAIGAGTKAAASPTVTSSGSSATAVA
jgi:mono/diheme cytochrome c family protein